SRHRTFSRDWSSDVCSSDLAKILTANNAVDFDVLLLISARLIRSSRDVREELQSRFQYLLIDEYQDTNHAQFVIAHSLASASRKIGRASCRGLGGVAVGRGC